MSAFELKVAVHSASLGVPSPEALEAGETPHVELGLVAGLPLPIPNPQTGQPIVIPLGGFNFLFGREQAIEIFEQALTQARGLPEATTPSGKIMVASNMGDVAQAAENIGRFR